ncbi:hypothetical protein [Pseudomonas sediminis]
MAGAHAIGWDSREIEVWIATKLGGVV